MITPEKQKKRQEIEAYFRNVAQAENSKNQQVNFTDLLLKNSKKQFLIVCPESAGDCLYVSAILQSFRESYPSNEWNLYLGVKPEFAELFDGCEFIDKILPYHQFMDSELFCLGQGKSKGMFQGYCFVTAATQRYLNYLGNHNLNIELK